MVAASAWTTARMPQLRQSFFRCSSCSQSESESESGLATDSRSRRVRLCSGAELIKKPNIDGFLVGGRSVPSHRVETETTW